MVVKWIVMVKKRGGGWISKYVSVEKEDKQGVMFESGKEEAGRQC